METPATFNSPERQKTVTREATEAIILQANDGQQFSGLFLNRDFASKPAIVRPNAWMASALMLEQQYAGYQYAATHPERPVLLIDMPSHGKSSNLTDAQRHEMAKTKEMTLIGRAHAEAIKNKLPDLTQMTAIGDSLGARSAADLANESYELDIQTDKFFGFEMVGLEKRRSVAVAVAYFVKEWRTSNRLYGSEAIDPELEKGYEVDFKDRLEQSGHASSFSEIDVYRNDPRLLKFLVYKSPLANDTGKDALKKMLETQPNLEANIVIGGLSSVCRWRNIQPYAIDLQKQFGRRAAFDVWDNDSHGMSLAPMQPILAKYTARW